MSDSRVTFNVLEAVNAFRGAVVRGMGAATLQGEAEMKVMLSKPGTGETYGNHRASAPGDPPAPDTGQLRMAIGSAVDVFGNEVTGRLYVNKEYAAALETGTEKMAARPYLKRSLVEGWQRIMRAFSRSAKIG